jgi:hypothetical protein
MITYFNLWRIRAGRLILNLKKNYTFVPAKNNNRYLYEYLTTDNSTPKNDSNEKKDLNNYYGSNNSRRRAGAKSIS